ncbi:thiamine biosynthesis protein [Streptomyces camponoticapitis]|uniref:Thiamine biosynthesis protein n=1 Tax=Streptomyces camponoticapitis TaxID=1616125 RepID=A0ABQ2E1B3_9ACTN|nr:ABC transporter substrate-binding protein [Streptomyces camponoticapitis]GGJ79787.1 thiamine biosynthesis protein [Streptomyces camponoticapitis]
MRRLLTVIAVAALTVGGLTACSDSESTGGGDPAAGGSGKTTAVKVGVIPIVDVAPIYLGKEKGFYEKHGIGLTLTPAQGGAAIVPGVVSGDFQFGFSNVTSLLVAQSKKVPLKAVANGVASTGEEGADFGGITVKKDSPLRSAADLEGKKVAVNTLKNIGDTSVKASVEKAGGDPSRVEFVELPFDQMPAALDAGQVDAAWVVEPGLATIKAQGGRVIASNYVDVAPDLTVAMYFTSTAYAKQSPEVVKAFQDATRESLAYADSHPDEVRRVITTYTKIPEATLKNVTLPKWPAEPNRSSIDTLAELGRQDGLFTEVPDLDELLP